MGMFGIPDEPPCYILFGLILAKLPLINNNRLKEFLYRSLYGLLQHRVTIPYVSHVSEAPLSMGYILKVVGVYCDTYWIKPGLYILRGG